MTITPRGQSGCPVSCLQLFIRLYTLRLECRLACRQKCKEPSKASLRTHMLSSELQVVYSLHNLLASSSIAQTLDVSVKHSDIAQSMAAGQPMTLHACIGPLQCFCWGNASMHNLHSTKGVTCCAAAGACRVHTTSILDACFDKHLWFGATKTAAIKVGMTCPQDMLLVSTLADDC